MAYELVGGEILLREKLNRWGYKANTLQESIALYQANHAANLNELTQIYHGRAAVIDGDLGLATAQLVNTRFCDVPDIMPGAQAAVSEANWPDSCRQDISVAYNFTSMPGLSQQQTRDVWLAALKMWNDRIDLLLHLVQTYGLARINAKLEAMLGSILAWSYLAQNNCSAKLQQAYNRSTVWTIKLAPPTIGHEVGHALGLDHTPGDPNSLMYPSMRGQQLPNETDLRQMVTKGYKRRTSPPPDDDWSMF